jgi:hypothetical protein
MSRFRNFCFTTNNYVDTTFEDNLDCKYIIYGKETASTGTPHLQGFISFPNAKSLSSVIKLMRPRHVEVAHTLDQAIDYCKKDGDYVERGVRPVSQKEKGQSEKRRWELAFKAAAEGRNDDIPYDIRFKHDLNIKRIRQSALQEACLQDTEMQHLWYYGPSGTGKSYKARRENPEAYLKMCNKWWCGYTSQSVCIIEDFDIRHEKIVHHLKIWADRYPFTAEVKGGAIKIRPALIIVTSNYHPNEIWHNDSDLRPILRRFKCVSFNKLQ